MRAAARRQQQGTAGRLLCWQPAGRHCCRCCPLVLAKLPPLLRAAVCLTRRAFFPAGWKVRGRDPARAEAHGGGGAVYGQCGAQHKRQPGGLGTCARVCIHARVSVVVAAGQVWSPGPTGCWPRRTSSDPAVPCLCACVPCSSLSPRRQLHVSAAGSSSGSHAQHLAGACQTACPSARGGAGAWQLCGPHPSAPLMLPGC